MTLTDSAIILGARAQLAFSYRRFAAARLFARMANWLSIHAGRAV